MAGVTIKVRLGGPYKVSGAAIVRDAKGAEVVVGGPDDVAVLCRCGRSAASPICDGSHRRGPEQRPQRPGSPADGGG